MSALVKPDARCASVILPFAPDCLAALPKFCIIGILAQVFFMIRAWAGLQKLGMFVVMWSASWSSSTM